MANDYLFLDYDDVAWPMSSCLRASSQAVFMAKGLGGGGLRERDKRKERGREEIKALREGRS